MPSKMWTVPLYTVDMRASHAARSGPLRARTNNKRKENAANRTGSRAQTAGSGARRARRKQTLYHKVDNVHHELIEAERGEAGEVLVHNQRHLVELGEGQVRVQAQHHAEQLRHFRRGSQSKLESVHDLGGRRWRIPRGGRDKVDSSKKWGGARGGFLLPSPPRSRARS